MRDAISILTKKQIIDDVDTGLKYEEVRINYVLKNVSYISRIYKDKNKWLDP